MGSFRISPVKLLIGIALFLFCLSIYFYNRPISIENLMHTNDIQINSNFTLKPIPEIPTYYKYKRAVIKPITPICPCNQTLSQFSEIPDQILSKPPHSRSIACFLQSKQSDRILDYYRRNSSLLDNHISLKSIKSKDLAIPYDCDIIVDIVDVNSPELNKLICPENCFPIPIVTLADSWIENGYFLNLANSDKPITCSLTMKELTRLTQRHDHKLEMGNTPYQIIDKPPSPLSLSKFLRIVLVRRQKECREESFWPNKRESRHSSPHFQIKRKVHGMILWIGSIKKIPLVQSQVRILSNQPQESDSVIVGWVATEEIYPCRQNSSQCNSNANYHLKMPQTRLHDKRISPGWACAQRRPLRALAHVTWLYDPNYMMIVDDDTFVNINILLDPIFNQYLRDHIIYQNVVMGEMHTKAITKHGFIYGGSGYLFGRKVIEGLNSNDIIQTKAVKFSKNNTIADHLSKEYLGLSISNMISSWSPKTCSSCIRKTSPTKLKLSNRLVDVCSNTMAGEGTCYHSDHSLCRCLFHGLYVEPMNIPCSGRILPGTNLMIGMCFDFIKCDITKHLTCHRWQIDEE